MQPDPQTTISRGLKFRFIVAMLWPIALWRWAREKIHAA